MMKEVDLERGKREALTGKKEVSSDTESTGDADRATPRTIANGQGGLEARVRTVSKNPWCIVRQVVKISFSLTLSQSTLFRAPLCLSVSLSHTYLHRFH